VPILVFLGLSILELGPMYATRQTDVRQKHRLMPPPYGGGGIIKYDCDVDIRSEGRRRLLPGWDERAARSGTVQHGVRGSRGQSRNRREASEGEHATTSISTRTWRIIQTVSRHQTWPPAAPSSTWCAKFVLVRSVVSWVSCEFYSTYVAS